MDSIQRNTRLYQIGIPLAAVAALLLLITLSPSIFTSFWPELLLSTSLVMWLVYHRFDFTSGPVTLIHALSLTVGITIGITPALISVSLGMLLYAGLDQIRMSASKESRSRRIKRTTTWLLLWGRQILSNSIGLYTYTILGGHLAVIGQRLPDFWPFIGTVTTYSITFLVLHWISPRAIANTESDPKERSRLTIITLAPMPVVLLAISAYVYLNLASFVLYTIVLASTAPILSSLIEMEWTLRDRARILGRLTNLSTNALTEQDPEQIIASILETATSIGCGERSLLALESDDQQGAYHLIGHDLTDEFLQTWQGCSQDNEVQSLVDPSTGSLFLNIYGEEIIPEPLVKLMARERIQTLTQLRLSVRTGSMGYLVIFSRKPLHFTQQRKELLTLFANQAANALSNVRSRAFADQAISLQSDQLTRLEEINRQLTTSSAADNLHEIILDYAIEATAASWGYLALHNAERDTLKFVAYVSPNKKRNHVVQDQEFSPDKGVFGRAYRTGQIINLAKASEDPNVIDPLGTKAESILCIPICGPESILGVIGVEAQAPHAFGDAQERFLTQLVAYAANALHHAKIYHALQDRLTEQSLLYQASTQIAESLESDAVGMAIADSLRVTVHANSVSVFNWYALDQQLQLMARIDGGRPSNVPNAVNPDLAKLLGHAQCLKDRVSMQWSSREEVSPEEVEYLTANYGKGRLLLLPLGIGERPLGIVEIFRREHAPFTKAEIRSAQSIAIQASIALDNTTLFQKISESHNRVTAILNSTREGFLLVNTDGYISLTNRQMASMIGIGTEELQGKKIDDEDLDLAPRLGYQFQDLQILVDSLLRGQEQLAGTAIFQGPGDTPRTYFRVDAPVHDLEDHLIGWLISIRDISEQREIEETREQLSEMIVHDLRSPLTAILNSIVLLRREMGDEGISSGTEQALAVADRSVNQMLGLVNSLLDISRLESGKMKITPALTPVKSLIEEIRDRFQLEANSIGIILNLEIVEDEVEVSLDREKVQRVLANLVDNALKFTPVGGTIGVGYIQVEGEVEFWVRDTGPGIPQDFHEKIFDRYIQIPGMTGRRRGTGLGLAFARLAVEAHRGRVWVEDNPDGGSVFKFRIPSTMHA